MEEDEWRETLKYSFKNSIYANFIFNFFNNIATLCCPRCSFRFTFSAKDKFYRLTGHSHSASSSTAPRPLPNEDLREGELRRPDVRAERRLRQHNGSFSHVWLSVLQRDGRSLADVRAARLQRQDAVPQARRVQEPQRDGEQHHKVQLHQAHYGLLLTQNDTLQMYCE